MGEPRAGAMAVLTVRTLLGHAQVPVALRCLASLVDMCCEPLALRIHDDGTLSRQDVEMLQASLPGGQVVSRPAADDALAPRLASYPNCCSFRRANPLALKLFDVALLEQGDLAYADSDVLFLRPFRALFDWANARESCAFMTDVLDAYALRPWHVSPLTSLHVLAKANTGIVHCRAAAGLDLDKIEYVLGRSWLRSIFMRRSYWVEQTCWAVIGAGERSALFHPSQLRVVTPDVDLRAPTLVAAHFVSTFRGRLAEVPMPARRESGPAEPHVVKRVAAGTANPLQLLWTDVRRRSEAKRRESKGGG